MLKCKDNEVVEVDYFWSAKADKAQEAISHFLWIFFKLMEGGGAGGYGLIRGEMSVSATMIICSMRNSRVRRANQD
jgi:hypothetical protein